MPWSDKPASDWDRRCEEEAAEWNDFIKCKKCRDCVNCYIPEMEGFDNPTGFGFCIKNVEFVYLDDFVSETGCGEYEE